MQFSNKKKLLFFNSITGVVQLVLTVALIFVCTPLFISVLGLEAFGAFGTVSVIGSLSSYANLSLDSTLIKYISEQGKTRESDYDIITSLILLLLILVPLTIFVFVFKDFFLLTILKMPLDFLEPSRILLDCLLVANLVLLPGRIFTTILDVNHKIYLTNLYQFIYNLIYWGGIILVLTNGFGLEYVGFVVLVAAFVWFGLAVYSSLKIWGRFSVKGLKRNFGRIVRKQLKYSTKIYTGSLLNFFYEPLTKILISNFLGLSYAAIYDITLRIKINLFSVYQKLLYPIQPLIAQEQSRDRLKTLIEKVSQIFFYLVIPSAVILLVCTKPIMTLWIGGDNIDLLTFSTVIMVCLSLLMVTTVTPIYIYLRLKNQPSKEIYVQGLNVVVNLLFILVFYRSMGYYAIVLANAVSVLVSFLVLQYYQKKYLNFYSFSNWRELLRYISVFGMILLFTILFSLLFKEFSWINIILVFLFCGLISLTAFYFVKILKKEDLFLFRKEEN
ncbi:MAG: oligosaccharide flippase family protein [Dysgonamonadaceae bacterium]|nr:oligosaccharide flippase family protein [Dysgonamonadaceae bacterium]